MRGDLEAGGVEDLRADVRVQPDQLAAPGAASTRRTASCGVAAGQREAELLVLVRGRDELVGVRLDADGDADEDRWRTYRARRARAASRSISSKESTTMRPTPASSAAASSSPRLVVAVQADPVAREPGAQRHRELAAGADVEAEALLLTQRATAVQRNALAA